MTTNSHILRSEQPLSNNEIRAIAPSVFATQPWEKMSAKYTFIPTIQIVEKMRAEGFAPFAAAQSRTRVPGKGDFTKHMIRFRDVRNGNVPAIRALGQVFPELILTNSHDGLSAYKLDAGLFRLVCMNGMVVCDGQIGQIHVTHKGSADGIIDASYEVIEQFPQVLDSVERFSNIRLEQKQQEAYAEVALSLRYEDGQAPVTPQDVVQPRRYDDAERTLWNTFNTTQEHLTQGGLHGRNPETRRRVTTRPVNGINENTRLNKALWALTQKMAELVS